MDSPASLQEISSADAALAARLRKIHSIAIGVAVIWFVASVVGTLWLSNRIFAHDLMQVADDATRDTHATARVVDRIFHEFATIPRVLSNNRGVIGIVDRYNAQEPGLAGLTEEQRGTRLKNDPEVRIQGDRLTRIRKQLNYGLVYVIDSHGIVVVSSDWDRDPSFVGLKVDDRQYFNDAMAGREGQMFAVARVSSDPVLIFSSPIQGKAGPIGAVALSQRISVVGTMLSVGHQVTLVVDHNGMVVATSHPEFYLHYISEADRAPLSNFTHVMPAPDADTLRKIYNQENLRTVDISRAASPHWYDRPRHDIERVIEGRHYLVTSDPLKAYTSYSLFVFTPINLGEKRLLHYLIGLMVTLLGFGGALLGNRRATYLARRRHSEAITAALNEKLRTANAEKDHFLGIAAHDLRNPLSSMRGLSELMLETQLDPDQQREFLGTIRRTSDELLGLVNDLLDVSVIESGKLELRYKDQDVARLVDRRARLLEPLASGKQIKLVVETPGPQMAKIDAARFSQIIDNLVSNAIKFSAPGTTVQVSLHSNDGSFVFSVQDQGPGISEADRKLLFRRFQKLSARPTAGERSTGLGLSIVKRIIDAHNGRIDVDSALGRGTCFTVTVPLAPEAR